MLFKCFTKIELPWRKKIRQENRSVPPSTSNSNHNTCKSFQFQKEVLTVVRGNNCQNPHSYYRLCVKVTTSKAEFGLLAWCFYFTFLLPALLQASSPCSQIRLTQHTSALSRPQINISRNLAAFSRYLAVTDISRSVLIYFICQTKQHV